MTSLIDIPRVVLLVMEEQLALVDVHTGTVADTWPLILGAVQRASFIALDLVGLHECMI